jgi:hypothetical protein
VVEQSDYRLRFKDLFRADFARMYLAKNIGRSRAALRIYAFGAKLEKLGDYKTRIVACPPLPLLWAFRSGDGSSASVIHKTYLRAVWQERATWAKIKLLLAILLIWPFVNLLSILWFTSLNGEAVREWTGKNRGRQVLEQLQLSAYHSILPPWYYMFRLYEARHQGDAAAYLHRFETKGGVYRLLNPHFRKRSPIRLSELFNNKAAFYDHCLKHGLRTVPIAAFAEQGEIRWNIAEERLPEADLFLKPTFGRGGQGAQRWDYQQSGIYKNNRTGEICSAEALLDHVKRLSQRSRYLVQLRLRNHPDIIDLSNGALLTFRIVTVENELGRPEATDAVLRIAQGNNTLVDNLHAGGISARVDMITGRTGKATDVGARVGTGWLDRHPDTGVQIEGRQMPFWRETVDLVERAHATFIGQLIIGWDIPVVPDGPCLIEANSSPDLDIMQIIEDKPIGNARLGEILVHHIKAYLTS